MVGLPDLTEAFGDLSETCQVMGRSRDTIFRLMQVVVEGGAEALLFKIRRRRNPK